MRKLFAKLAVLLTAVCLSLCCGLLAACGDDSGNGDSNGGTNYGGTTTPPANTTYNVTVQLENGSPIAGILLKFCTLNEQGEEENCLRAGPSDAEGKITATFKTENYHIGVIAPAGYQVVGDISTANVGTTFTITVKQA